MDFISFLRIFFISLSFHRESNQQNTTIVAHIIREHVALLLNSILPPFQKSRKALLKSTVTGLLGSFLGMTMLRRHLQEMHEPNQAFLLFWNGGSIGDPQDLWV